MNNKVYKVFPGSLRWKRFNPLMPGGLKGLMSFCTKTKLEEIKHYFKFSWEYLLS